MRKKGILFVISLFNVFFINAQLKSPEAFLGYKIGTRYTPHWKIVSYFEHVAAQSSTNVKLENYGVTNEGRPLLLAFISSKENTAVLDEIRMNNMRLANTAKDKRMPDEQNAPAIVWLSYNVHGNEASSSDAAMMTLRALADPAKIIEAINDQGVTQMFASPALLHRLGRYGRENQIRLASFKRVISAGAPVSADVIECFAGMLSEEAEIHTPYGATEAVPVLSIRSHEILAETRALSRKGFGTCIGYPINDIPVRIIRISDEPILNWSEDLVVPDGEVGEIIVKGALVTRSYFNRPDADALAKIRNGDEVWHRMGDLGRRDEKGRVWFYGRKSHRVITPQETLFTIPCEAIFNSHPKVFRSALVGVGKPPRQRPVICIELEKGSHRINNETVRHELLELAKQNPLTRSIETILFCKTFPVDIRHNAKIFREKLSIWAAKKTGEKEQGHKTF